MKINHFFGGILLIAGTTVGAGILGLPIETSLIGFFPSLLIFVLCWLVMLATAYFFLDVNFAVEGEPNLISMAHQTLGKWGQVVSWICYLLLLYSLTAAYIAVSAPLFSEAFQFFTGSPLPHSIAFFVLPLVFGSFIYLGTEGVDLVNRLMMIGLIVTYVVLIIFLPEKMDGSLLLRANFKPLPVTIPIIVVSFGYHIIIPSLTTYMHHDKRKLRWILLIGSAVPLVLYIVWEALTLGVIPFEGKNGLAELFAKGDPVTAAFPALLGSPWITTAANFFAFFVIVTSFLGVSLSLSDFLVDGFKIKKSWEGRLIALALTFIPPLIFVFTYQHGFFLALKYSGIFVSILLIFLPAMMAWKLKTPTFYRTIGGRILLASVIGIAALIVIMTLLEQKVFSL